jgi:hypothetical protein
VRVILLVDRDDDSPAFGFVDVVLLSGGLGVCRGLLYVAAAPAVSM